MGPEIIVPRQISNQTDEVEHDNSKKKRREQRITFFMRIEYDSYKFGVEYKSNQNNVPNT
ncbi:hypothetical protein JCM15093_1429 [Bacteroides graminisolvens DSM 19988 = JCM 15093]|uniref:Uncharacterized protein n=1 Tax=Bacteroides graminisolvens DSM 19988 = JCM 15093 TaxID=1121097 RepID=A0A069D1F1_9BACE|nr:hypothetical protein JCM15093_1429 [Bacteroides graminisolvens DSM 19988 = JCM 15093]